MRLKTVLLIGASGTVAAIAAAVVTLAVSPLYTWMPHQPRDTSHLFGDDTVVIAHRGWSAVAPENTLAAFSRAADLGVSYELDVSLCASGEAVVLHDDTLDRTTNGTGGVGSITWNELQQLDAGSAFSEAFAGEPVPRLADVLAAHEGPGLMDIELKTTDDKRALANAVVADIVAADMIDEVFVSSFDPFLLEAVRLAEPRIVRGQLVGSFEDTDLAWYEKIALQNLVFTGKVQPDLIIAQHDWLTPDLQGWLQAHGYRVFVWTVNDVDALSQMRAQGVDGIITDVPDKALLGG